MAKRPIRKSSGSNSTAPVNKAMPKRTKTRARTAEQRLGTILDLAQALKGAGVEQALTKAQLIGELCKSPHGDLSEYAAIGLSWAKNDPDFFGHLLAWNERKGQVRDSKVALPCLALASRPSDVDYVENALAHLADLPPFMFVRGLDFLRALKAPSRMTRRLVKRYIRDLEADKNDWEWAAIQHRRDLHEIYARFSLLPGGGKDGWVDLSLMKNRAEVGRLAILRRLKDMPSAEAASAIARHKIPFKAARGALAKKVKEPDLLLALLNAMSPDDVVSNSKALQKWGVMDTPATRAAYEDALKRVAEAKTPRSTLKTSKAAEVMAEAGHEKVAEKLKAVQEKQLDKLKGIDGNWLVLTDKSGSMHVGIEAGRPITATLARLVKGKVSLVFFDQDPRFYDATGKTLEQLTALTKGIVAGGGTDIGCGLRYAQTHKLPVDGIVIVSDGADHALTGHRFGVTYAKYARATGNEPTVYFYKLPGEPDSLSKDCETNGIDLQVFDLTKGAVDYYSLPNLVQTMRVGRYSLLDEVLDTDLRKLDQVLTRTVGLGVVTNHGTPVTQTV